MGSREFSWAVAAAVLPILAPLTVMAQTSSGMQSADLSGSRPSPGKVAAPGLRKNTRRGRSLTSEQPERPALNDWSPHYFKGKAYFVEGRYDEALTQLVQNVADCDLIDFDSMRRQNEYFDHISNSIPLMGQSPHEFIRASNLQWVGAALAAQGHYDEAEAQFTEMANYAGQCFAGRLSTFAGCSCQGLAFLLAARGRYDEAAQRYRLALAHIEGNQSQIGLPPAPCVAMILVALADVELARGRLKAAESCIIRAGRVQEAQRQLGIGPAPLDRAALLTVFAQMRYCQGRSSEAYDLHAEALEMIREVRKGHPLAAYCLDGLGEIDLERGRLGPSEDRFLESLAVRRGSLGESHREVAYSFVGLARVAAAQGKNEAAESFFKGASSILQRELGPAHPDVSLVAAHMKSRNDRPHAGGADHPTTRFLAIPTFLTVGWQVLHVGKDWRVVENNIRQRAAKAARAAQGAKAPPEIAGAGDRKGD